MNAPWNWHLGQGSLPHTERGFDLSVRTQRMGDKMFAVAQVGTPWGPVKLCACADMKTIAGILGASGVALHRIAARLATEGVMKKVTEATCNPSKTPAAERLYARLKAKEPKAWQSTKVLCLLAKLGDPKAAEGLACLRQVHAKATAVKVVPMKAPPGAPSTSGCSSHSGGLDVFGTMDSPLRGASYSPFEGEGASGFASHLPPPFVRSYNIIAGAPPGDYEGWYPYRPIPYGRLPTSYPPLPMGPYKGYAAGIMQRQEASYIAGTNAVSGSGRGIAAQGMNVLCALGSR